MPLPAAARLTQLAAEHLRAGRFHEAEPRRPAAEHFRRATELDPPNASAHAPGCS